MRLFIASWVLGVGVPMVLVILHTQLFGLGAQPGLIAQQTASWPKSLCCWRAFITWWSRSASCAAAVFYIFVQPSCLKKAFGCLAVIFAILLLVHFAFAGLILIFFAGTV